MRHTTQCSFAFGRIAEMRRGELAPPGRGAAPFHQQLKWLIAEEFHFPGRMTPTLIQHGAGLAK
jgi:hypothetical protein